MTKLFLHVALALSVNFSVVAQETEQNKPETPVIPELPQGQPAQGGQPAIPATPGSTRVLNDLKRPPGVMGQGANNMLGFAKIALCKAINEVKKINPAAGEDLEKSKSDNKFFWKSKLGFPAVTLPDGQWMSGLWPKVLTAPINTPHTGNIVIINSDDFEQNGGTPECGLPYRYGPKGLAIILLHEWKHMTETLIAWEVALKNGDYKWERIMKHKEQVHVTYFTADMAQIDACIAALDAVITDPSSTAEQKSAARAQRQQLVDLRKLTASELSKAKASLVSWCKKLGE